MTAGEPICGKGAILALALSLVLAAPAAGQVAEEPAVLHVNPATGIDLDGRGSSEHPLRTATFALGAAGDHGMAQVEIRLAPGVYRAASGEAPGERFPLRLPPAVERLVVAGGEEGATQLVALDPASPGSPTDPAPVFEIEVYGAGRRAEVELSRLEITGGIAAACFAAGAGGEITGRITDCVMSGQSGKAIEAFISSGAIARLEVKRSVIEDANGGVAIETAASSTGDLLVDGCVLRSIATYGPGGILGAGVEAHLDPGAVLAVKVLRNVFWNMASAVQLTAAEENDALPSGGTLDAVIAGNLIGGLRKSPGAPAVKNGIYLSLWPHHEIALEILSNGFVGIGEHVLHHDNLDALRDLGRAVPWTFANNIAWDIGAASEFDEESPGFPFPPAGTRVTTNILSRSALRDGVDGNFSSDPLFEDEAAGDYRLRADSPARDRGDASFAAYSLADLDGRCRIAAVSCPPPGGAYPVDIGPYEYPGFCERDAFVFRRGDCNLSDNTVEITDAIFTFGVLFVGDVEPRCQDACDSNDDGKLNITDGIFTLFYLFSGGLPIPPPTGADGTDPTGDCLSPCL
jgi:hypothetical protein